MFVLSVASVAVVVGVLAFVDLAGALTLLYSLGVAAAAVVTLLILIVRRRPVGR